MNARRIVLVLAVAAGARRLRQGRRPRLPGLGRGRSHLRQPRRGGPRRDAVGARGRHGRDRRAAVHASIADLQQADLDRWRRRRSTNAQQAYDRAQALLKTSGRHAEGARRRRGGAAHRAGAAQLGADQACAPQGRQARSTGTVQQIYYRPGEMVPAGRPVLSLLPPGNSRCASSCREAMLPTIALGDAVNVRCDGCASRPDRARSASSRARPNSRRR